MPNTRSKKNRQARQIQDLDLSPGSQFPDRFNGKYTVQAVYGNQVHFWWDGSGCFSSKSIRQFLQMSLEDFYTLVFPWPGLAQLF